MKIRLETLFAVTMTVATVASSAMAAALDSSAGLGNVRLKGYLGGRLDAMIERHVAGTDADYITAAFMEKTETKGWWQTEFWGKWMHSAVPYSVYLQGGTPKTLRLNESIRRGIDRMLSSQEPCGYIGNYPDELRCGEGWDVWGMKYTMMGLLHYYDATKDENTLAACRRLCDYLIGEIGPGGRRGRELWQTGNWSGYASSSILEPVMWLYNRTKDARYLDFASYIVKGMTEPEKGPRLLDLALKGVSVADRNEKGYTRNREWSYVCKYGRSKAYEMMSCYQGLIEYFEVTGRRDLLDAAVKTAEDIVREEVNLAGGCASSEAWFHGSRKQHLPYERLQETCVTTTWMRFCEKLLDITGDSKWADQIERTFYNAYLAAMKSDGSEFAGYTPLSGNRWHGQHHCYMHTDCCTANGPRGFLCFLKKFFRVKDGVAEFNFYGSALVKADLPDGGKVSFDVYSLYPRTDSVRIVSHTTGNVPVRFRIPAWSAISEVKLNGTPLSGVEAGRYFTVSREWKLGDIVELKFDMPVVAHRLESNVAFTRGPVVLARDSRFADGDMTMPFRREAFKDGETVPTFTAVHSPSDDIWMAFSATLPIGSHSENPESANPTTVFFCDYASAGNTWHRDNHYRIWFPMELGPQD
ncbi:MAG: glycoside hydrolase family 127 protein [Kiritimatiellae bacterium]|nr:glycoside hydrolase family 127 protein [Kiritimatiellia bacterium]